MKKWQVLFLVSFLALTPLQAQIYHAGEENSSVKKAGSWLELSAAGTRMFSGLEDRGGHDQLSHQDGLSGRALVNVLPWLGLGVEGTWFEEAKDIDFVNGYKALRYGIVGKFTLTPSTQPQVYLLAGIGKTKRELDYAFALSETAKTHYLLAGIGVEVELWSGIFLALEGYGVYDAHKHFSRFFAINHRLEPGTSFRIGKRF